MESLHGKYHGGQNDYQNNSKIILICNRTNKKLPGRKSCSGLVTGNFESSKLFEGLVILKKKKTRHVSLSSVLFHLVSSLLIFLVFHLVFRVVSRLSSSLSRLSASVHFVRLSVSVC